MTLLHNQIWSIIIIIIRFFMHRCIRKKLLLQTFELKFVSDLSTAFNPRTLISKNKENCSENEREIILRSRKAKDRKTESASWN